MTIENLHRKKGETYMLSDERTSIAAIAYQLISNKKCNSVYSYDVSRNIDFLGKVTSKLINVYDSERNCFLTSSGSACNNYNVFDSGLNAYVSLRIRNNRFEGYDYNSGMFYNGKVDDGSITIFDYETGKYHQYSV